MLLNKQRKAWEEDVIKNFVIYMPVSREVLLEMAWRMLLLKASWMSDIKKKKKKGIHVSLFHSSPLAQFRQLWLNYQG